MRWPTLKENHPYRWFAWYPVIADDWWVWLEFITRTARPSGWDWEWEYHLERTP